MKFPLYSIRILDLKEKGQSPRRFLQKKANIGYQPMANIGCQPMANIGCQPMANIGC